MVGAVVDERVARHRHVRHGARDGPDARRADTTPGASTQRAPAIAHVRTTPGRHADDDAGKDGGVLTDWTRAFVCIHD